MESKEIINALIAEFALRVEQDKIDFGVVTIFMPNPILTTNPKFCLIGMEPSTGGLGNDGLRKLIEEGHLNFLYSKEDFILHY